MTIEYGFSLPKRMDCFKSLERKKAAKLYDYQIDFMNREFLLPVWLVPIGFPKYRLKNGRTSSLQEEWLSQHSDKPSNFFSSDPEREEAQKAQHQLLKTLINEADLLPTFKKPDEKQKSPLILDSLGFVVNGNRRLCTWRELYGKDPKKYKHFGRVQIIVLPPADEKAIDMLEAELQVKPEMRADYSWHALANMLIKRMVEHHIEKSELQRIYGLTDRKIEELIEMRNYAIEYMKSRNIEGRWSEMNGKDFAFKAMLKGRKQIKALGEKKVFEAGAFCLLDDPKGGRLYEYIPDMQKYQSEIQEKLLEEFPIDPPSAGKEDLLGTDYQELFNLKLAEKIDKSDKNRAKAGEIIKGIIEQSRLLDKEKDSANYVRKQMQIANAAIQEALMGIKAESVKDGVDEIVKNIEEGIVLVKKWLKK